MAFTTTSVSTTTPSMSASNNHGTAGEQSQDFHGKSTEKALASKKQGDQSLLSAQGGMVALDSTKSFGLSKDTVSSASSMHHKWRLLFAIVLVLSSITGAALGVISARATLPLRTPGVMSAFQASVESSSFEDSLGSGPMSDTQMVELGGLGAFFLLIFVR